MEAHAGSGSRDIQSLHRAFDILEAIGEGRDLGVTELARKTSLPVSTVHNLLRTMAKRHYVVGFGGRYNLGPAVTVLTAQWDPVHSLSHLIQDHVRRVIEATGQTAFGTMLVGNRARVIAYRPGAGLITVNENHEDNADPLGIATGRVMVAMKPPADWEHFISAEPAAEPQWSTEDWQVELAGIAATGVCVRHLPNPENSTGIVIAVPVWGPRGEVICSIAAAAATYLLTEELVQRIVDALWSGSQELSDKLGCESIPMERPTLQVPSLAALVTDHSARS